MALGLELFFQSCMVPELEVEPEPPTDAPPGPIHSIPNEMLIGQIFSRFSWRELPRLGSVCQLWREGSVLPSLWNAFDLQKEFPVTLFDEKVWRASLNLEKSKVSFADLEPMDNHHLFPLLAKFFSSLKHAEVAIEQGAGATLLTLPKGLSLEELIEIKNASANCNDLQMIFGERIIELFGKTVIEESHRVLITNSILTWSWKKMFFSVGNLAEKMNCASPHAVEAAALGVLTYAALRKDFPARTAEWPSFAACVEEIADDPVIVGGFQPKELSIKVWHDDEFGIFRLLTGWIGTSLALKV